MASFITMPSFAPGGTLGTQTRPDQAGVLNNFSGVITPGGGRPGGSGGGSGGGPCGCACTPPNPPPPDDGGDDGGDGGGGGCRTPAPADGGGITSGYLCC